MAHEIQLKPKKEGKENEKSSFGSSLIGQKVRHQQNKIRLTCTS